MYLHVCLCVYVYFNHLLDVHQTQNVTITLIHAIFNTAVLWVIR